MSSRRGRSSDLDLTAVIGTTAELDDWQFEIGATLQIPSGSSITSIIWYTSHNGTDYARAQKDGADWSAVAVDASAEAKSIDVPAELFGALHIKPLADAAGTVGCSFKN